VPQSLEGPATQAVSVKDRVADLNHERDRLYRAVDSFIESCNKSDYDEIRIDTFGVVAIGTWMHEEDEVEAPFQWFESRRQHVQIGVLRTCLMEMEANYFASTPDNDDD